MIDSDENQAAPRDKLLTLLRKTTQTRKHQAYQTLPEKVQSVLGDTDIVLSPRYEKERFAYLSSKVDIRGKTLLDIGCNTGYFLFEALARNAKAVTGYEGGLYHAQFVQQAAQLLGCGSRLTIHNKYYQFEERHPSYNVTLLLNILHHIGDDYEDKGLTLAAAKIKMAEELNSLHTKTNILVFQLGFNWKGDITKSIFSHGTKAEMIDFVKRATADYWDMIAIGVAEGSRPDHIIYQDLNKKNLQRDDSLGEFLNRPLFILRARR